MIRSIIVFLTIQLSALITHAQHNIHLRNLWVEPNIHIFFQGYTVSFALKDVNKAMYMQHFELGDVQLPTQCDLDSNKHHYFELFSSPNILYRNAMQEYLHVAIGCYLLGIGKAHILNPKKKLVPDIIEDVDPNENSPFLYIKYYDAKTHSLLFSGRMLRGMYHKDIGIDD